MGSRSSAAFSFVEYLAEVKSPANIIPSLRRPEHEKLVPLDAAHEQ